MADVSHPVFARLFDRLTRAESAEEREHRRRLLAGLHGRVLEVGAGNGRNLELYPAAVDEVVLLEPEPYLRRRAEEAAAAATGAAGVRATVVDGVADALPFPDASFDAVVFCLVLCSVPSPPRALAEARRVLVPGGALRVYEHVAAAGGGLARAQRALDATVWPRLFGGCHTHRDTGGALAAAGFEVERAERHAVGPAAALSPVSPHLLAQARRA